ncbi:ComEC/Rec2 family competence protein [Bacteroidota bacterium]
MKLVYGETSFLFTGDAGFKVEDLLIDSFGRFINVDLLKVGHHGSKNSTSDIFLDYVSPETAVISAGIQNKFRHPAKLVLDKLKRTNIKIDRTDLAGAILYQTDGNDITKIDWKSSDRNWLSNY